MKEQIIKISEDLKQGIITEIEAINFLLNLFSISGNCLLGHKWSKWIQQNVEMTLVQNGQQYPYIEQIQIRYCLNCNKMQKEKFYC